jgi:anti-anti-sigma factor
MLCPSSFDRFDPGGVRVVRPLAWSVAVDGFTVHSERDGRVHHLTPVGELDLATVPILEREFHAVDRDATAEKIVVDLTRLRFMDCTAINLLARLTALCAQTDRLRVVNGSPAAERLLDLTGMRAHLPVISRRDDPLMPVSERECPDSTSDRATECPARPT